MYKFVFCIHLSKDIGFNCVNIDSLAYSVQIEVSKSLNMSRLCPPVKCRTLETVRFIKNLNVTSNINSVLSYYDPDGDLDLDQS